MLSRCSIIFSSTARAALLVGMTLLVISMGTPAAPSRGYVVCREELSRIHREQLATELRKITGLSELRFDDNGILREGAASSIGGSASARELIANAIHGRKVVVIESAGNRSEVAFGRVVPGKWKRNTTNDLPIFVVQIDFADFGHLVGDERALEAFNVGWGFLHELDHAVNDSPDATSLGETGECEAHINQMRRECDLPERADYFSTLLPVGGGSAFKTQLVRLAFEQKHSGDTRKKRYWLIWDVTLVGGVDQNQIAALR